MSRDAARGYHHGDLRNALILAAVDIIEESGSLHFSMADAARRAGVSSAAPYRHFRDRDALLEAVAQLAFFGLGEASRAAVRRSAAGSIECIIELGKTYIDYVTSRAAFYDLMWGDIGARAMDADNFDRKASGFFQLTAAVREYLLEAAIPGVDAQDVAVQLWAMVHGLSAIGMSGKLEHLHPNADLHALIDSATRTFMRGLGDAPGV
jgi:AcrR family transcriptional regulator